MSRTPETIVKHGAVTLRRWVVGIGLFCGFGAYGLLNDNQTENDGAGLFWGAVCLALLWWASKIKTRLRKNVEIGGYR